MLYFNNYALIQFQILTHLKITKENPDIYCIGPTKSHYLIVIRIIWATRVCPVLFYDMTIALWSTPFSIH